MTSLQDHISVFITRGEDLEAAVERLLELESPELLSEEMEARLDFKNDLTTLANKVGDKIDELESLKRKIREVSSRTRVSADKLERRKIDLYVQRKKLNA